MHENGGSDDDKSNGVNQMSELSLMKVISGPQDPTKGGGGDSGGGGSGRDSGRVGDGSGSVWGAAGGGEGGKEPAVKNCGIMTTATFTKLVSKMLILVYT